MSSITIENNTLVFQTPYHPALVQELKSRVPASERMWDGAKKAWRVAPQHGQVLANLAAQYLGEMLLVPQIGKVQTQTEVKLLDVRYIGTCKERTPGNISAFGWSQGSWSVVFSEAVLKTFFLAGPSRPGDEVTLYSVLGATQTATSADIKSAYRRMARQWHPDVCKEADAQTVFMKIQHAYEILSDDGKRARYDAGLALQASIAQQTGNISPIYNQSGYRSPLRCGYILAEGVNSLGRFIVEKILDWQDIVDPAGRTLVVSWPAGADKFMESWV